MANPSVVDLFCGAGGLSLGFHQAGFWGVAAIDADEVHTATYALNFPRVKVFVADIASLSASEIADGAIDVVAGGPPCQGFSCGGIRESGDPRNNLVFEFARIVEELRPRAFVFENVGGILETRHRSRLNEILRRLKSAGYNLGSGPVKLDARWFGVPQRRKRVIIIGSRTANPHVEALCRGLPSVAPTVRDAIEDLPAASENPQLCQVDSFFGKLPPAQNAYAERLRERRADSALTGCRFTVHSPNVRRRFRSVQPGKSEPISRFIRLAWHGVSPTLRAGTDSTRGSHTAPRPIHPDEPRCITVREAARLHSYPDWFQFAPTVWHGFRQIGNSVPPLLAKAVAAHVAAMI